MASEKCRGHKTSGAPCSAYPVRGTTVCSAHGGRSPQVRAAAARRLAVAAVQADAAALLAAEGIETPADPYASLERVAGEVLALKSAAAARVNSLTSIRYTGPGGGEQLRAEVALYERALDRAERILSTLVKLGLDERRVVVQETIAEQFIAALRAVCDDLGLDAAQRLKVPGAVDRAMAQLRLVVT